MTAHTKFANCQHSMKKLFQLHNELYQNFIKRKAMPRNGKHILRRFCLHFLRRLRKDRRDVLISHGSRLYRVVWPEIPQPHTD